eukprot:TRINITY_DN13657_c0_g1_i1.p1 TRINITY_DN13657_c0_g1~~TRINITY_DN13657_c0_g1_i1.p1  ORF type:complete len:429 (-),score=100.45 TRINITY_DN13657_c0_g1_i1:17-1303(-)
MYRALCRSYAFVARARFFSVDAVSELQQRGLVAQISAGDAKAALEKGGAVYAGFDPTASSLHAGHLAVIAALRPFALRGHKVVAVIGGATARIGDPSGRVDSRPVLPQSEVVKNAEAITAQLKTLLPGATVVDNYDWWKNLSVLQMLSETGRHMRVNAMLNRDSVKARLADGAGMSFAEMAYQVLQAHDFLHLHREHNVVLQVGGSDQWGNITAGIELIRRVHENSEAFGVTVPLLTIEGAKMGKSSGNALWLDPKRTSPYELHHFFVNLPDPDAPTYLKIFSETLQPADLKLSEKPRETQTQVADAVVRMVHGDAAVEAVHTVQRVFFGNAMGDVKQLADALLRSGAPGVQLPREKIIGADVTVIATAAGVSTSPLAAKKVADQNGLAINNRKVPATYVIQESDLLDGKVLLVRTGKKTIRSVFVQQ